MTSVPITWDCGLGCPPIHLDVHVTGGIPVSTDGSTVALVNMQVDQDHLRPALAAHYAGTHDSARP